MNSWKRRAVDEAGDDLADRDRAGAGRRDAPYEAGRRRHRGRRLGARRRRSHGGRRRPAVEVRDDRAAERQRVLVVERLVVGDAGAAGVDLGAAELLGA